MTIAALTDAADIVASAPSVDAVAADERAASLGRRSIKREAKRFALDLTIRCMDLTSLEGADTAGRVLSLCDKAVHPDPLDHAMPSVAAVCVYPARVAGACRRLAGTGIRVASVATAFPSGQSFSDIKTAETRAAVEAGANEIDMVLDRSAFLRGDYARAFDDIVAIKEACGRAHLKVILETGELGSYDAVRRASHLAMAAGADFIKTSTGKVQPAATLPVSLVMLEAVRDWHEKTGRVVGFKAAGGLKTAKQAIQHIVLVNETLGREWLTPERFRVGASTLLNDVLQQLATQRTGRYWSPDYVTEP